MHLSLLSTPLDLSIVTLFSRMRLSISVIPCDERLRTPYGASDNFSTRVLIIVCFLRFVCMTSQLYWHLTSVDAWKSIQATGSLLCRSKLKRWKVQCFDRPRYRPKQVASGLDDYVFLGMNIDTGFLQYRLDRGLEMIGIGFTRDIVTIPGARIMNGNGLRFCHRESLIGGATNDGNGGWLYPQILCIPTALPLYPWAKSVVCLTYSSSGPQRSPMETFDTSTLVR